MALMSKFCYPTKKAEALQSMYDDEWLQFIKKFGFLIPYFYL